MSAVGPRSGMPTPPRGARPTPDPGATPAAQLLDDEREGDFVGGRDLTHWPSAAGRALHAAALQARRWLLPHQVWALTLLVGLVLTGLFTAAAAGVYDSVVQSDGVTGLDQPALRLALAHRSPGLDAAVTAYTDIGGPIGMPVMPPPPPSCSPCSGGAGHR